MPSNKLRVGVTGVGGASGQSVIKALRMSSLDVEIVAMDVTHLSAGLYMADRGVILPKPEEDIGTWIQEIDNYQLDAVIPGADRDLIPLASHPDETRVISCSLRFLNMARDKFKTMESMAKRGFPIPITELGVLGRSPINIPYPCVLKPRNDAAGRGFHICNDEEEFQFYLARTHDPMVQEYLEGDEYSCNVFCDALTTPAACLIMKRVMRDGVAYRSEPVDDPVIRKFGMDLALSLRARGPINIQLRKTPDGDPMVFEINARCSGSTAIRAALGYNDPEMMLRHFVLREQIEQPTIDYSKFCFRYYEEIMIPAEWLGRKPGDNSV